jgi:hypothetical protein
MSSPFFNSDQSGDPWCGFTHDEFRERLSKRNREHVAEIEQLKSELATLRRERDVVAVQRDALFEACRELQTALKRFAKPSSWTRPAGNFGQSWRVWADDDDPAKVARQAMKTIVLTPERAASVIEAATKAVKAWDDDADIGSIHDAIQEIRQALEGTKGDDRG